ncbi:hypothetical protein B4135_0396 [Caldibacillus debilis]|uniref:Uncharacterized protein n=1 Tax=Caldibacillus debilis TaxID=301148 RepID=A0A150L8X5_9BACI|nr:hypothetical protein B4135_0396 [Caldibacillus debilis]
MERGIREMPIFLHFFPAKKRPGEHIHENKTVPGRMRK